MEFHKDLSHVGWEKVKERQLQRKPLVDEWIELVGLKRGSSVLDIGTGPGVFTLQYADIVGDEGTVYALDQSKEALDIFLKEAGTKVHNIVPLCKDAEVSLDFVGNVDIVMISDVLHHSDAPANIIKNVYQRIDEYGRVLIAEFDPDSAGQIGPPLQHRISKEEIKKIAQSSGFKIFKEGKQSYEHYYLLLRK